MQPRCPRVSLRWICATLARRRRTRVARAATRKPLGEDPAIPLSQPPCMRVPDEMTGMCVFNHSCSRCRALRITRSMERLTRGRHAQPKSDPTRLFDVRDLQLF